MQSQKHHSHELQNLLQCIVRLRPLGNKRDVLDFKSAHALLLTFMRKCDTDHAQRLAMQHGAQKG